MVEVVRGIRVGTRIFTPHGTISNGGKLTREQRDWLRESGGYQIDRLASLPVEPPPFDEQAERIAAREMQGFAFVNADADQSIGELAKRHLAELMAPITTFVRDRRLIAKRIKG